MTRLLACYSSLPYSTATTGISLTTKMDTRSYSGSISHNHTLAIIMRLGTLSHMPQPHD